SSLLIMPAVQPRGAQGPSCFDRVKLGFLMGFSVGVGGGLIFGTFGGLRMGYRGRELVRLVGSRMLQGGGSFGLFLSIGTLIRC
ncbi:hypothetical protein BOX15_Mlig015874g1, partial [Macrostomum lignano]